MYYSGFWDSRNRCIIGTSQDVHIIQWRRKVFFKWRGSISLRTQNSISSTKHACYEPLGKIKNKKLGAKNKGGSTRNKGGVGGGEGLQPPPPPPPFLRHCSYSAQIHDHINFSLQPATNRRIKALVSPVALVVFRYKLLYTQ